MAAKKKLKLDYEPTNAGARGLAAAIIIQAAEDYGNALLGNWIKGESMSRNPKYSPEVVKLECEKFFRSEWFEMLAPKGITGEAVMQRIKEITKNWPKDKSFNLRLKETFDENH